MAEQYASEGDFEKALNHLEQEISESPDFTHQSVQGFYWRARSTIFKTQEKHLKVIETGQESSDRYEQAGMPLEAAKSKVVMIRSLALLGRFAEAKSLAYELLDWFEDLVIGRVFVRSNLIHTYFLNGEFDQALNELKINRQLCLDHAFFEQAVEFLMEIALAQELLYDYENALTSYELAAIELKNLSEEVSSWIPIRIGFNHAILLMKLGRFEEALHILQTVRQENTIATPSDLGFVNMAEGSIRSYLGDSELAIHHLEQAYDHFVHPLDKIETQLQLCQHLRKQTADKLPEALDISQSALELLADIDHLFYTKLMLIEQAETLLELGRFVDAQEIIEEAIELSSAEDRPIQKQLQQMILAEAILRESPDQALALLQRVSSDTSLPLELTTRVWISLGDAYSKLDEYSQASSAYKQSLALLQQWRHLVAGHVAQAGFLEQIKHPLDGLLNSLIHQANSETEIWTFLEQIRSQALEEEISRASLLSETAAAHDLFVQREQLLRQVDLLMRPLSYRNEGEIEIAQADAVQKETAKLTALKSQLAQLEESIRREIPSEDRLVATATDQKLAETIPGNMAVLTWFSIDQRLYVMVKFGGQIEYHSLVDSAGKIDSDWQQLFRQWMRKKTSGSVHKRSQDLWNKLTGPVRPTLSSAKKLLIIPTGPLWQIAFGGLIDSKVDKYVSQRWEITIAPSVGLWQLCQSRVSIADDVLLVGVSGEPDEADYLPAVLNEIEQLNCQYPDAHILRDEAVTRDSLLNQLTGKKLVHIAGHIEYESNQPIMSGIRLHNHRYLRASDFYLRPNSLGGAHVVLSGCNSGRVNQKGTEIVGLPSSLVAAGAKSVLVSLWPIVDEATAAFMSAYYQHIKDGASPSTALSLAQNDLIRSEQFDHPVYWAAFANLFS